MKYFLSPLLLLLVFVPCQAQKLNLALNLKKGNTYYITGTSNSAIVQSVSGQDNKVDIGLSYRIAFKVIGATDSIYNMEVRYQTLAMKIMMANNTMDLDSRKNDKQDIPSTIITAMMNKPFSILMTKSGKIRSIKNIEEMMTSVLNNFPQIDPVKKEQVKAQLLQTLGGSAFKSNLEMQTAIYPQTGTVRNNRWMVNTKLESTFKVNMHTAYQLTNAIGNSYQIHGSGTAITDKGQKPSLINGLPVKYNVTGTSTADIKVDKTTGWVSSLKLKQMMKGNTEVLDNPKVPGGAKIPMTFNADLTSTDR